MKRSHGLLLEIAMVSVCVPDCFGASRSLAMTEKICTYPFFRTPAYALPSHHRVSPFIFYIEPDLLFFVER
jgi:hypothetical protein